MKAMAQAKEFNTPPIGRYKARLTSVEPGMSSSGKPKLSISGEIIEPAEHAGAVFFDTIITDGTTKGAGFSKAKLRGLGIDVDSDVEIPDEELAARLTGVETYVDLDHQPRFSKNPATGDYDIAVTQVVDGKQVPVMNLKVSAYLGSVDTAAAPTPAAEAPVAPAAAPVPAKATPAPAAAPAAAKATPPWKKAAAPAAK